MKKLFSVLAVLLVATALFAQVGLTVKAGGAFGFANYKSVAEGADQDGETVKFEEGLVDKALVLKEKGLGFDVGVQYDITDKLLAYVDFNMLFPKDAKLNYSEKNLIDFLLAHGAEEEVINKYVDFENEKFRTYSLEGLVADMYKYDEELKEYATISTKYSFFSVSAGVAYKLDFSGVKLNVGGGVTLSKASAKFNMTPKVMTDYNVEGTYSFTTIGVNALVEAKYMVADGIGVGLTLMPQLGLYNKAALSMDSFVADPMTEEVERVKGTITASGISFGFAMPIVVGVSYTF